MLTRNSSRISSCSKMLTQLISPNLSSKKSSQFPFTPKIYHFSPNFPTNQSTNQFIKTKNPSTLLLRSFSTTSSVQSKNAKRKSTIEKINLSEAQEELCDYLHNTRGYLFTDADHVSKNAPLFLQNLFSQLKNGESFTKYLLFHQLNEFEPFFESLGLSPHQFKSFLPPDLVYLSDDPVLVSNFHILCYYGFPRSKIGKIYLGAPEIFRYSEGVLDSKINNYKKLGLGAPEIIKLVTCYPALLTGDVNLDFCRVLEKLRNLGVEFDLIINGLSDKSTFNWVRIFNMLNFLEKMGCEKTELGTLIKEKPSFVFLESGKNVYLLVAMLIKLGFKMNNILNFFMQNPYVLVGNFVKYLGQSVSFLFELGMEIQEIKSIILSNPQVLGSSFCNKLNSVLQDQNLTSEELRDIIKTDPTQFINLACKKKDNAINLSLPKLDAIFAKEKTEFLLKLGFAENSEEFIKASSRFRGRGDQLQERFDCLVKAGLDCQVAVDLVKGRPSVLNQSASVLETKIDYLLNELGYPIESVIKFPSFLAYNMERVRVRFEMVRWLEEKKEKKAGNGIQERIALSSVLAASEERFCKLFVDVHPDGRKNYEKLKKSVKNCMEKS